MIDISQLFQSAQEIFDLIAKTNSMISDDADAAKDILTTGAVDTLGSLSLHAKKIAIADNAGIREKYLETVQRLADFLEAQGHGNVLKEAESIDKIWPHFPQLVIPPTLRNGYRGTTP